MCTRQEGFSVLKEMPGIPGGSPFAWRDAWEPLHPIKELHCFVCSWNRVMLCAQTSVARGMHVRVFPSTGVVPREVPFMYPACVRMCVRMCFVHFCFKEQALTNPDQYFTFHA